MIAELYLIDNAVMNILVIRLAAAISGRRVKPVRAALFASAGAIYALAAASASALMMHWTLKIAGSLILSAVLSFGSVKEYFVGAVSMFAAIFVAGGAVTCVALLASRRFGGLESLSPLTAIAGALITYLLPYAVRRLRGERASDGEVLELVITNQGQRHNLKAVQDTGNMLIEPISGLPVIVIHSTAREENATIPIPASTVFGDGMLFGFRPDRIELNGRQIDAVVVRVKRGFGDYEALIPPCFIKMQERGAKREDGQAVL